MLDLAKMFARNIAEGRLKCKQNTPGESKRQAEKEVFETARRGRQKCYRSFFVCFRRRRVATRMPVVHSVRRRREDERVSRGTKEDRSTPLSTRNRKRKKERKKKVKKKKV